MTYHSELAEALHRNHEVHGGDLVFRDTEVRLEEVFDEWERGGDPTSTHRDFPSVHPEHLRIVRFAWEVIAGQTDSVLEARARLRSQADWALISDAITRQIDEEGHLLADPPLIAEVQERVREGLQGVVGRAEDGVSDSDSATRAFGWPVTIEDLREPQRSLGQAADSLRGAAASLQAHSSVRATLARELARRVDELAVTMDPTERPE